MPVAPFIELETEDRTIRKLSRIVQVTVGDREFSIQKFMMFTASRIGTDAIAALSPVLGGFGALAGGPGGEGGLLDQDIAQLLPALGGALAGPEGAKLESILKSLLIKEKNVHFENEDGRPDTLTQNNVDDVLDGDIGNMIALAVEVVKANYGSLFTMLGIQSGSRADKPSGQVIQLT